MKTNDLRKNALCLTVKCGEKIYVDDIEVILKEIKTGASARIVFIIPEHVNVRRESVQPDEHKIELRRRLTFNREGS